MAKALVIITAVFTLTVFAHATYEDLYGYDTMSVNGNTNMVTYSRNGVVLKVEAYVAEEAY